MLFLRTLLLYRGGGVTPFKSVLTFKIALNDLYAGDSETNIRADKLKIEIELWIPVIYGIMRELDNTSSAWIRTDKNIVLEANANQCSSVADFNNKGIAKDDFAMAVNGGTLPFYKDIDIVNMRVSDGVVVARLGDANFTWDGTCDGEAVDVMTYYPGHYIKRWQDDEGTLNKKEYIQLSMYDFNGAMYIAPYYRGTFEAINGSNNTLRSYAGGAVQVNTQISTFRTNAGKSGMSIGDWRDFDFLCLYLIKYADYNSQAQVGRGNDSNGSIQNTGFNNAHTTLLGRDGYIGTNGQTSIWCLGLCNPWGNVNEFIDGITMINRVPIIATDPDKYQNSATESTNGYERLGYSNLSENDTWSSKTGYDANNPLLAFPTAGTGSETTGLCDKFYLATAVRSVCRGGYYDYGDSFANAGAFFFYCNYSFNDYSLATGCRLLKQVD